MANLFELYVQNYEFTAFYTLYAALCFTVFLRVFWLVSVDAPLLDSTLNKIPFQLSESDLAYKYNADLAIDFRILLLKKIKMKISPDEDPGSFFSQLTTKNFQEEKNEKVVHHRSICYTIFTIGMPVNRY